MTEYIIKRLLLIPVTLIGIFTISFLLLYIVPGDPVATIVGQRADIETIKAIRSELNLDKPLYIQYITYLTKLLQGDLGKSFIRSEYVLDAILERFPATLELALSAISIAITIGIPIGVISAVKQYSFWDRFFMIFAIAGVSAPGFWVGQILILLLAYNLKLLPDGGYSEYFPENIKFLILPALALGIREVAVIARLTRSSMLEVIRQDYIKTARAKGVSELIVITKHALRNALIPIVTYIGMDIGYLLGGAVITETIFTRPGIGLLAVQALRDKDIPIVLGTVLFSSLLIVIANLITDLSYALLDPRVKLSQKS
ncbi:MAG: glutathione ABC transporter permease [Candidatus Sericytochromatia bacterium]|nr:MAG: glutathione ABC transporter permease [Candidatus Sericytochromatia bacterium]